MSVLDDAKKRLDFTVDKQNVLQDIYHFLSNTYSVAIDYITNGITVTLLNGQKFVIGIEEIN